MASIALDLISTKSCCFVAPSIEMPFNYFLVRISYTYSIFVHRQRTNYYKCDSITSVVSFVSRLKVLEDVNQHVIFEPIWKQQLQILRCIMFKFSHVTWSSMVVFSSNAIICAWPLFSLSLSLCPQLFVSVCSFLPLSLSLSFALCTVYLISHKIPITEWVTKQKHLLALHFMASSKFYIQSYDCGCVKMSLVDEHLKVAIELKTNPFKYWTFCESNQSILLYIHKNVWTSKPCFIFVGLKYE